MTQSTLIALVVAGALLAALVLGALLLFRNPGGFAALFRRPSKPARRPGERHYYKPYWS